MCTRARQGHFTNRLGYDGKGEYNSVFFMLIQSTAKSGTSQLPMKRGPCLQAARLSSPTSNEGPGVVSIWLTPAILSFGFDCLSLTHTQRHLSTLDEKRPLKQPRETKELDVCLLLPSCPSSWVAPKQDGVKGGWLELLL